ncbi:MAG: ATP-dependent DNA helicase RecG [Sulfobacillus acidophilus]|uniref:Probable DNA 3'-5' helicase RecG n=1 Tax=Sulfobacillus acidophilus TaxID=53633 RepID=A0A2T2WEX4_9FIRM|nr:MAG: ATP-dependent DNA helicase RecG [Sulfobacillus acidophilus]
MPFRNSLDGDRLATLGLGDSVARLPGVGPKRVADFRRLGVETIEDLMMLWPRRHLDRTSLTPIYQLQVGTSQTVRGQVVQVHDRSRTSGQSYLTVRLSDGTGFLDLTFFHAAWLKRQLQTGTHLLVSGRVDQFRGRLTMTHPEYELLQADQQPRLGLIPVYPLAGDLKQRFVQDLQARVVPRWAPQTVDPLPPGIRQKESLEDRAWAIVHQHWPSSWEEREASRRRLVFDEFLRMSLAVLWLHQTDPQVGAVALTVDNPLLTRFLGELPFVLTPGQEAAWNEIRADLMRSVPMARLLQGDVGSGKTILAALAMLAAIGSGLQAALMAPTELLAEQHYLLFEQHFAALGVRVILVSGRSKRTEEREMLQSGLPLVAIGTQALLSDDVDFGRLGLVVVDEQHRFGVRQRAQLGDKGLYPHMLVMTATPIPRTLALTVYGDLQVSQIEGLPPGRQPIATVHLAMKDRRQAYLKVMEAVRQGRQAYVICPLVEGGEEGQGKAATLLADGMKQIPGWRIGLIHGKMSAMEKSRVMDEFRRGAIDVLVGTTILEVGVDVPNATVIVIEEADRFGLAQLHQLRGRVGRGSYPSICFLLADATTAQSEERIQAMVESQNGLELAERDLQIRGPGEVLGMRQHGVAGFQLANPLKDLAWLERARQTARQILAADRTLAQEENQGLRQWVVEALREALPGHVLH